MHFSDYYINRTFSNEIVDVNELTEGTLDIFASELTAKLKSSWLNEWFLPNNISGSSSNSAVDLSNNNYNTTTTTITTTLTDFYFNTNNNNNNRTKIFYYNNNYNDSTTIYLSSSNSTLNNYWALLALLLVVCTAAGNILVCLAITWERRLQNVTNYFLMSLAITDLMVAILVMPLGILTLVKGERVNNIWPLI